MLGNSLDDDILDMYNPKLLIENDQPIQIHLEGFKTVESLKLLNIIEKHGGKLSGKSGPDVVILSPPQYRPKTQADRFHIDWLHKSISLNVVENLLQYRLKVPEIKIEHEVEVKNDHPIESINVQLQENFTADSHSSLKDIRISGVFSLAQIHALPNIINENLVPEKTSEIRRMPKCRTRQQPVQPSYDSPEENQSSKNTRYLCTTSPLLSSPIVSSSTVEPSTLNIALEVEEEDYRHFEPMNVELQQEKSADVYNNVAEGRIGISEAVLAPQTKTSTDDKNTVPEDTSKIPGRPKGRTYSQQSVCTSWDSFKKNKSSKNRRYRYTEEEKSAMIQYVIDNDAFRFAGGQKIWKEMHKDGMMQNHSPNSMASYFSQILRHRIRDLTSDEEALKKFQLREIKPKRRARKLR